MEYRNEIKHHLNTVTNVKYKQPLKVTKESNL